MMRLLRNILVLALAISCCAYSYEIETHAAITWHAFNKIADGDSQLLDRLGLSVIADNISDVYYDVSANVVRERFATDYEKNIVVDNLKINVIQPFSAPFWLLRGAIREDDGVAALFLSNPQDDPYGNINRFLNHFFDPVNNAPLSIGGQNHTAPAWALGTTNANAFGDENTAESGRRNHYTVKDAREYLFRALTGMDGNGSRAIGANGSTPNSPADMEAVRKAYWATTFRALGDIVHLVQDMGQPQHTRNDPHSPINIVNGERVYEKFTNQRALGGRYTCFFGFGRVDEVPLLDDVYGAYPVVPRFNLFGSFFSTGAGSASGVASGKGLADYSNRGFFTAGTNVGMSRNIYSSPALATAQAVPVGKVSPCFPPGGEAVALKGTVQDTLDPRQSADDVPLTTRGLWDRGESDPQVRYSLNEQNYIAMADLLIPRAVAYSAGLIDHFFRGRMEITPPDEGVYALVDHAVVNGIDQGFTRLKLKLRNITPAINDGQAVHAQAMGPGTLYAVVKFRRNPCYQPDLSGEVQAGTLITDPAYCRTANEEIVVSDPMNVQNVNAADPQTMSFVFSDGPIPINATDVYLQIVYRGRLGSEADAVVVATRDISEPTYVSVTNSSDYIAVDGVLYTQAQVENEQGLQSIIDSHGNNNGSFDETVEPFALETVMVGFSGSSGYVATHGSLAPQATVRLAMLQELEPGKNLEIFFIKPSAGSERTFVSGFGRINQLDEQGIPQITGIDEFDNLGWVGPFRGIHHQKGLYVFRTGYDPDHNDLPDWSYEVSGLVPFANPIPVPVDRVLVGF